MYYELRQAVCAEGHWCYSCLRAGFGVVAFLRHKKSGGGLRLPRRESIRTPLYGGLLRPPRPFPTSSGSAFVLPFGFQSRVFLPPFFIDACASISRDRVSLSSHPHGTTAFLGRTRSGRRTLYHLSAGRSVSPSAFRRVGLPAASLSLRSRSRDPSLPSGDSDLSIGGFHLTGDSNYSHGRSVSKAKTVDL